MIRLRFDFLKRERDGKSFYELIDSRPFPGDLLPALLIMICQEIDKLDIPADNPYKLAARGVLEKLGIPQVLAR